MTHEHIAEVRRFLTDEEREELDALVAQMPRVGFGQYADATWPEVAAVNPGYVTWALSQRIVRDHASRYRRARNALLDVLQQEREAEA